MARVDQEFFHVESAVAESVFRFGAGGVITLHETGVVVGDPHAAAAAAGDRLDDHRIFELMRGFEGVGFADQDAVAAGSGRDAGFAHGFTCDRLISERAHRLGCGPDEGDAVFAARFGEVGVLREKAVSRMNRVDVADCRHRKNPVDQQIAGARLRRPDADRFVRHLDRHAVGIGL